MLAARGSTSWTWAPGWIGLLALVLLAVPSTSLATVDITPSRIVVSGPEASARIERDQFRMVFAGAEGKPILEEVENTRPAPYPLLPVPDTVPLGTDAVDGPTLYSPLSFTVGAQLGLEYPATLYVGNRLLGLQAGITYSPRSVLRAKRIAGGGAELLVSTNDPAGRQLVVEVAPAQAGSIRVSARVTPNSGVASISDSFASPRDEAFHGFGGRHNAIDQRGTDFYNWVQQQNVGAGPLEDLVAPIPGSGGEGYLFPAGPAAAFYVQSQFVSTRGYGFLLDRDEISGWRMASDRSDAWQVSLASSSIDYVVSPGGPRRAIRKTTEIGGRHDVPPRWALEPELDRLTAIAGETEESYKDSVEQDLADIKHYDLPLKAYRIEAWQFFDRAYLRDLIARLHRRGLKALVYFRPFVGTERIGTDDPGAFDEALAHGWVATTASGSPYVIAGNFAQNGGLAAMIDFTDPGARKWWEGRIHEALDLGADGFMQDFGEQVLNPMHFDNGQTGAEMHNRYPVLFHKTTDRAVKKWERKNPGRKIWFFTRSGYSGSKGSAAYERSNFPGDETTDWSRASGLASQTPDMLNRAVGGAFGFTTDIGGYFDIHTPPTSKELFLRWAEWAALSPIFRLHGSVRSGTHTPWSYDDETVRIYKRLSRLHLRAVPLIERLWRTGTRKTGIPPTRPLWLQFPKDPEAARQDQQWMLGPDVLVAPVVEQGARSRRVYFPKGCWVRPGGGDRHRGAGYVPVSAALGELPYFFRCGTDPFGV